MMKKLLALLFVFMLVGCSSKAVNETNDEPTIEKAKEVISSLVFDEGKGYKVEAFEQRPVDYSSIDASYVNTYIYETYRSPDQQISINYRYSGENHIFTKVGVYDSRDDGHYFEIGNDNTEYVTFTQPFGEVKKEGTAYIDDLPLCILKSFVEVKNVEIKDDLVIIEGIDESSSGGIVKYKIEGKNIQSIHISYNSGIKQGSDYSYIPIGNGMEKAEEVSLLVHNVDFNVNINNLPYHDQLKQNDELNKVVDRIKKLDFSIAEPVDVYIQDVQNKRNTIIHSSDFSMSTESDYTEYWFAYGENDDLLDFTAINMNVEAQNNKMYHMEKTNNYTLEDANYEIMHKALFDLKEPLFGFIGDIKVEENGEAILVKGITSEGNVCVKYIIENNRLIEMREEVYMDQEMKNPKYSYFITTQVPAWEYFKAEFDSLESKSVDEIKRMDYFKVGL